MKNKRKVKDYFYFFQYKDRIKGIAKNILKKYYEIPINWEDLVSYAALVTPTIVQKYDKSKTENFEKYFLLSISFNLKTYCRQFLSNKHKTLNLALNNVPIDEIEIEGENYNIFSYDTQEGMKFLKLSKNAKTVIELMFLKKKNIKEIQKITKFSRVYIKNTIHSFKEKYRNYFKDVNSKIKR